MIMANCHNYCTVTFKLLIIVYLDHINAIDSVICFGQ